MDLDGRPAFEEDVDANAEADDPVVVADADADADAVLCIVLVAPLGRLFTLLDEEFLDRRDDDGLNALENTKEDVEEDAKSCVDTSLLLPRFLLCILCISILVLLLLLLLLLNIEN